MLDCSLPVSFVLFFASQIVLLKYFFSLNLFITQSFHRNLLRSFLFIFFVPQLELNGPSC